MFRNFWQTYHTKPATKSEEVGPVSLFPQLAVTERTDILLILLSSIMTN